MNTSNSNKLLWQIINRNNTQGFTLTELLVVVIIIGILSAISLPSYLNLTSSAQQSEARQNISAIMTAQQVWIDEHTSGVYPSSFDQLALGVVKGSGLLDTSSSSTYDYSISNSTIGSNSLSAGALPKVPRLKTYTGGISHFINNASNSTWYSIACESIAVNQAIVYPTASGAGTNSILACDSNYNKISTGK
jgi:type IV pilus assembly protein PilA